jgi:hypothetical protein
MGFLISFYWFAVLKKILFPKKRYSIYIHNFTTTERAVLSPVVSRRCHLPERRRPTKNPILRNQLFFIADPYKN